MKGGRLPGDRYSSGQGQAGKREGVSSRNRERSLPGEPGLCWAQGWGQALSLVLLPPWGVRGPVRAPLPHPALTLLEKMESVPAGAESPDPASCSKHGVAPKAVRCHQVRDDPLGWLGCLLLVPEPEFRPGARLGSRAPSPSSLLDAGSVVWAGESTLPPSRLHAEQLGSRT